MADKIVAEFHGDDSSLRFSYRILVASALRKLGEFEQAESHLEVLSGQLEGMDRETQLKLADLEEELAYLHLLQSQPDKAEACVKTSLGIRNQLLGPNSEKVANSFAVLARIHESDDREVTASALAERALDLLNREEGDIAVSYTHLTLPTTPYV